jgi:8-oxo-dGTP diphosphatase
MVFYAEIEEMIPLPAFEIEEIKLEDVLPEGLNFGDMFYTFNEKWNVRKDKKLPRYSIDIRNLDEVKPHVIA